VEAPNGSGELLEKRGKKMAMKNRTVKVLFFDMGNTLLHFHCGDSDENKDEAGLRYLTDYLQTFNRSVALHEVRACFFDPWMKKLDERKSTLKEYPVGGLLQSFMYKYGVKLSEECCREAMQVFYTEYRHQVQWEPGLPEALTWLKEKGYRLGIISNACLYDEVMRSCFAQAGIEELFETYTFSYSAGLCKPRKEIFEKALISMNADPSEAVMIGDNWSSDIEPALKLGMQGILFTGGPEPWTTCGVCSNDIRISKITSLTGLL
jgi:HAD superfamily hydrolase (TIGR01549 family)